MSARENELPDSLVGDAREVDAETGPLADLLGEREQPRYALTGDSVEQVTQGRTTTLTPEGDHDAYLIVTDERVLVVLGDQPDVIEIEFDILSISRCNLKSGFLSTTLIVGHSEESIRFPPSDGDAKAVEEDISLLSDVYTSVENAIVAAEEIVETLETQIRETGEEGDRRLRVRSQLSEARHHATREDDAPTGRLLERIADREAEFDRRYVDAWIDRAETDLAGAETALENGDHERLCAGYMTVAEATAALRETLEELEDPPAEAAEAVEAFADRVAELAETYVEETRTAYKAAEGADDTETAATQWLATYRRLAAARAAEWESTDGTTELPLSEIESVAKTTVEALEAHADELEEAGESVLDDDAEAAREHFERAADRVRDARDVASEWSSIEDDAYEERLDNLADRVEVTEWEWGAG